MSADQPSGHSPLKATSPPGIRTTTKFSAAHAALPRLLPFAEPDRLVFLFTTQADPGEGLVLTRWSRPLIDTLTASYAYRKDSVARSPELYQAATLTRIRAGANVTLPEYIESRRQLDRIRHSGSRAFDTVDLLITPTVPVPPFPITDLARVAYTSCWSGRTTCGRLRKRAGVFSSGYDGASLPLPSNEELRRGPARAAADGLERRRVRRHRRSRRSNREQRRPHPFSTPWSSAAPVRDSRC